MNEQKTSPELSKLLSDGGCKIPGSGRIIDPVGTTNLDGTRSHEIIVSYDLLWDICVKYAKEFFGDQGGVIGYIPCFHGEVEPEDPITLKEYVSFEDKELYWFDPIYENKGYKTISSNIFHLIQQGKKQKAEDLIWLYCKFNPKNKLYGVKNLPGCTCEEISKKPCGFL